MNLALVLHFYCGKKNRDKRSNHLISGLYNAVSGSIAQERTLEIISNNLANMSTVGYKGDIPLFKSVLSNTQNQMQEAPGVALISLNEQSSLFKDANSFVVLDKIVTDFSQGVFKGTGNKLDVALDGDGFFAVETPKGIRYTRQGNFSLDSSNRLVTQEGYPVMSSSDNEIVIDGKTIEINNNGEISADGKIVGNLNVVDFPKPYSLKKIGNSLFASIEKDSQAKEYAVKQGFLELSNINVIREMIQMIDSLRSYQSYQKVIKMSMEVVASRAVNEIGRLNT